MARFRYGADLHHAAARPRPRPRRDRPRTARRCRSTRSRTSSTCATRARAIDKLRSRLHEAAGARRDHLARRAACRAGGAATTSSASSSARSACRCGRAASACSRAHQMGTCRMGNDPQTSVAEPVRRAARHEGRVDRRRQRVPDAVGHQPDGLDHGARAPHRDRDRRRRRQAGVRPADDRSCIDDHTSPGRRIRHGVDPIVRDKLYIGGEWVAPAGRETIDVIDATTEEVMGRVPQGTAEDVDRAVAAARAGLRGVVADARRASARTLLRAIAAGAAGARARRSPR